MKKLTFDFENLGGLAEIYAIPPSSFKRIRIDYSTDLKYLEVQNRDDIIVIPMFADDTFQFTEEDDYEDGGLLYSISVEGLIPKISVDNQNMISTLEHGQWYILCRDSNDVVHLCGTNDVKMLFKTNKSTGSSVTERNNISFTISNKQSCPSLIIELDDMSDL